MPFGRRPNYLFIIQFYNVNKLLNVIKFILRRGIFMSEVVVCVVVGVYKFVLK